MKKILILSPHADDEILGCGGFISKYSRKNYQISVLILTNANKGAPEIFSAKEIKKIRNEAKQANNLIGTKKLYFENLPALNLNNYPNYKITNIINITANIGIATIDKAKMAITNTVNPVVPAISLRFFGNFNFIVK